MIDYIFEAIMAYGVGKGIYWNWRLWRAKRDRMAVGRYRAGQNFYHSRIMKVMKRQIKWYGEPDSGPWPQDYWLDHQGCRHFIKKPEQASSTSQLTPGSVEVLGQIKRAAAEAKVVKLDRVPGWPEPKDHDCEYYLSASVAATSARLTHLRERHGKTIPWDECTVWNCVKVQESIYRQIISIDLHCSHCDNSFGGLDVY